MLTEEWRRDDYLLELHGIDSVTKLAPIVLLLILRAAVYGDIRTVALSGEVAPGTGDAPFTTLSVFDLDNQGRVAVYGKLHSAPAVDGIPTNSGIWAERKEGQLELIVRAGDTLPTGSEERLLPSPIGQLRDNGTVDFLARSFTKDRSARQYGLWSRSVGAPIRSVFRLRGVAPGFETATLTGRTAGVSYNPRGQFALLSLVDGDGKDEMEEAVWAQNAAGRLDLITHRPRNLRSNHDYRHPLINGFGEVAFGHVIRVRRRDYRSQEGDKNLIAIHGVAFPVVQRHDSVLHDGETFRITRTSPAMLNDAGQLAFFADVTSTGRSLRAVIKCDPETGPRLVAYPGMIVAGMPPGAKLTLSSQRNDPYINRTGQTVFTTSLGEANGKRRLGIWAERKSGLQLIAYEGGEAPDTDDKVFATFSSSIINAHGQVAFHAGVGDANSDNQMNRSGSSTRRSVRQGIWAQQLDGTVRLIVQPGDELVVGTDDVRIVQTAYLVGNTGNEDGRRCGFNDRGQVAFSARFTDGSWGIFVSDLVSHETALPIPSRAARRLSRHQVEAEPNLERRLVELERRANQELDDRRKREKETDGYKLRMIADAMRAEYASNLERLHALKQQQQTRDSGTADRKIQKLEQRQQLLESQWVELRTRIPTQSANITPWPSAEFSRDAASFMRKYGNSPRIRDAIAALMERLSDDNPRPLIVSAKDSMSPFDHEYVSAPFAKSIRPESMLADKGDSEAGIVGGALAKTRTGIGQMTRLKWHGKNLILDREHWDVPFGRQSRPEFLASLDRTLRSKGLSDDLMTPTNRNRRMAVARPADDEMNVMVLFMRLKAEARAQSGRSSWDSGGSRRSVERNARFSNENITARVRITPNRFRLEIDEHQLDQLLRIDSNNENVHIALQSDQLVFDFRKSPRSVVLGYVSDEQTVRLEAESFAELYRKQPELVEKHFYGFLDELRIEPPYLRFDPSITRHVLQQLRNLGDADTDRRASQLVDDLDHDVFSTRDAAAKELQSNFQVFRTIINREYANRPRSFEVRRQLRRIIAAHASRHGDIDAFILSLRLLDDIPYLVALLERTGEDDRELVGQRLRGITGQELESNAEDWRDWLRASQGDE